VGELPSDLPEYAVHLVADEHVQQIGPGIDGQHAEEMVTPAFPGGRVGRVHNSQVLLHEQAVLPGAGEAGFPEPLEGADDPIELAALVVGMDAIAFEAAGRGLAGAGWQA
jgi:hypothetical protein